jgi:hypothetical protein
MSIYPAAIYVDDSQEFHALHDAIDAAVTIARERFDDAEDTCARVDPLGGDGSEVAAANRDYRLADEALQVLLRLRRRVESVDVDEQVTA